MLVQILLHNFVIILVIQFHFVIVINISTNSYIIGVSQHKFYFKISQYATNIIPFFQCKLTTYY